MVSHCSLNESSILGTAINFSNLFAVNALRKVVNGQLQMILRCLEVLTARLSIVWGQKKKHNGVRFLFFIRVVGEEEKRF